MKKSIFVLTFSLLLILFSNLSRAEDKSPFERSVLELVELGMERDDMLLVGRGSIRCAGLYKLLFELFSRDFPNRDLSAYEDTYLKLRTLGFAINKNISANRGGEDEALKEAESRSFDEFNEYISIYTSWLTRNYSSQGEYFGSSISATQEIQDCKTLEAMLE
jgi:hypothetical protein